MSTILQQGVVDALNAFAASLAIEAWTHNPANDRIKLVVLVSNLESCHRTGLRVSYNLLNKINEKGLLTRFIDLINKASDPQSLVDHLESKAK